MLHLVYDIVTEKENVMLPEKVLHKEYEEHQLTTKQIAQKYHCSQTTVKRLLKKYSIKPNHSNRNTKTHRLLTKEFLNYHYLELHKTCKEIAQEVGMSPHTISVHLTHHNIPKRLGTRAGRPNNKTHTPKYNLTGKTFGDLIVLEYVHGGWLCQCKCGQTKIYHTRRLTHDKVKSCGCRLKNHGNQHHLWKGCGEFPASMYTKIYLRTLDKGLAFDVSMEYLWELFLSQNKLCALSKQPIAFTKGNITASLDRIDPRGGYTENNVQWVHKTINMMKWNCSQLDFIQWCHRIAAANP